MKSRAQNLLLKSLAAFFYATFLVSAIWASPQPLQTASALDLPDLPLAHPAEFKRFSMWGFDIYDARLWTQPGFQAEWFERYDFALELHYLRRISGATIAERSIEQMRRIATLNANDQQRWSEQLLALMPNVGPGDRIVGVHLQGRGVRFYFNQRLIGEISEPEFARQFMGIWLSPRTSAPQLRRSMISALSGTTTP